MLPQVIRSTKQKVQLKLKELKLIMKLRLYISNLKRKRKSIVDPQKVQLKLKELKLIMK